MWCYLDLFGFPLETVRRVPSDRLSSTVRPCVRPVSDALGTMPCCARQDGTDRTFRAPVSVPGRPPNGSTCVPPASFTMARLAARRRRRAHTQAHIVNGKSNTPANARSKKGPYRCRIQPRL